MTLETPTVPVYESLEDLLAAEWVRFPAELVNPNPETQND